MMPIARITVLTVLLIALLAPLSALAKSFDKQAKQASEDRLAALTIFVDATFGNRTAGAAKNLTRAHQAFARHGYALIGVETYAENGDLVGFFVSYRRAAAGAPEAAQ